jgi:hypothetical protein
MAYQITFQAAVYANMTDSAVNFSAKTSLMGSNKNQHPESCAH